MTGKTGGLLVAALGASLAAGCATTHQPADSGRIALVIRGGGLRYVKGRIETPVGPLGGDLGGLVAGDEGATRFARRARTELAVGVPAYVLGVAGVVIGLVLSKPVGWVVSGAGAAVGGTGIGLMGAGVVNAVDAVNVFNDGVDGR